MLTPSMAVRLQGTAYAGKGRGFESPPPESILTGVRMSRWPGLMDTRSSPRPYAWPGRRVRDAVSPPRRRLSPAVFRLVRQPSSDTARRQSDTGTDLRSCSYSGNSGFVVCGPALCFACLGPMHRMQPAYRLVYNPCRVGTDLPAQ